MEPGSPHLSPGWSRPPDRSGPDQPQPAFPKRQRADRPDKTGLCPLAAFTGPEQTGNEVIVKVRATTWLIAFAIPITLIGLLVVYGLLGTDPATLIPFVPGSIVAAGVWGLYKGRRHAGWTAIVCALTPFALYLAVTATGIDTGTYAGIYLVPGMGLWSAGSVAAVFAVVPESHRSDGQGLTPAQT